MKNTIYEVTENTVSVRGKLRHSNKIELPTSWKDLVDPRTITVCLTPIGSHQNLIVKRADSEEVVIQSNGNIPIQCYYHVFAQPK
jgi:hypothetical protein